MKKVKALVLLSGGLDSILAARALQEQKIDVTGLTFVSCFFNSQKAEKAAEILRLPLKIVDFSNEHLVMIKNPKYGYGKNMNPCLDCHLMMLKQAKNIMDQENFSFVATGEVLGQRPFSQHQGALRILGKEAGLEGYLVRPLSAKCLEITTAEKEGLVQRKKLYDIRGRGRKQQLEMAKKWKIVEFPTPAGGCLLTDPTFSQRLKNLLNHWPDCRPAEIELLKIGRVFWQDNNLIIVGRSQEENKKIESLARLKDTLITLKDTPGPTTIIRFCPRLVESEKKLTIKKAQELTQHYTGKIRAQSSVEFLIQNL